jgi:hypothetical protein
MAFWNLHGDFLSHYIGLREGGFLQVAVSEAPPKSAAGAPATALRLLKTDLRPDFIWEFGRHSSNSVEIRAARVRCIGGFQPWPMPDAVQHDEATKIGEVTAHPLRSWLRYEV